jgi:tetratricopeptide (TPR) repeat protein
MMCGTGCKPLAERPRHAHDCDMRLGISVGLLGFVLIGATVVAACSENIETRLREAGELRRNGEYWQARESYLALLPDSAVTRNPELHASLLVQTADTDIELGVYGDADARAREAIAILKSAQKTQSAIFVGAERLLADALLAEGNAEEAKTVAEHALAVGNTTLDLSSASYGFLLTTLAQIMRDLHNLGRAQELGEHAVDIFQKMQGAAKIDLGTAYQNLAILYTLRGRPKQALTTINLAVATWDRTLPPNHPYLVYAESTKMLIYTRLKFFREGEELMPHMLAHGESRFGRNHPERVVLLNNAAALYTAEKRYEAAEPLLREAVEVSRRNFPSGHRLSRDTLLNYSYVLAKLNRKEEAAVARAEGEVVRAESMNQSGNGFRMGWQRR